MNEIIKLMNDIIDYLKECVDAMEDFCGTDDDTCYKPAKDTLDKAEKIKRFLEEVEGKG